MMAFYTFYKWDFSKGFHIFVRAEYSQRGQRHGQGQIDMTTMSDHEKCLKEAFCDLN